jgi:hypothetical protein
MMKINITKPEVQICTKSEPTQIFEWYGIQDSPKLSHHCITLMNSGFVDLIEPLANSRITNDIYGNPTGYIEDWLSVLPQLKDKLCVPYFMDIVSALQHYNSTAFGCSLLDYDPVCYFVPNENMMTVKIICNQLVAAELRDGSGLQVSTCEEPDTLTFIKPCYRWARGIVTGLQDSADLIPTFSSMPNCACIWLMSALYCTHDYYNLIAGGCKKSEARIVLSNSVKVEIICTANLDQWVAVFKKYFNKTSSLRMQEIMLLLKQNENLPERLKKININ